MERGTLMQNNNSCYNWDNVRKAYKMVLKQIDLEQEKVSLEQILAELESESEILLTKGAVPIAHIAAASSKPLRSTPRILGLHEGQAWISEDFTDELPNSFWLGEENTMT
jgi:antitoxin (DNA-binding transcriptional repressor) of toxin-antitoxin stability system